MPFFPGGQAVWRWIAAGEFGRPIEVRSLFLHSSDLDPGKPAGWKRRAETNGAYGCLGDLGMHALHLPLRARWAPLDVSAVLADVFTERPDGRGGTVPCDTPDNAVLLCRAEHEGDEFLCESRPSASPRPHEHLDDRDRRHRGARSRTRRSTPRPCARCATHRRAAALGGDRPRLAVGLPEHHGAIFEFGFADALQQMWAAFLDELAHGRDGMRQPFRCVTPEEAAYTHDLFTAALRSDAGRSVEPVHPRHPLTPAC